MNKNQHISFLWGLITVWAIMFFVSSFYGLHILRGSSLVIETNYSQAVSSIAVLTIVISFIIRLSLFVLSFAALKRWSSKTEYVGECIVLASILYEGIRFCWMLWMNDIDLLYRSWVFAALIWICLLMLLFNQWAKWDKKNRLLICAYYSFWSLLAFVMV